MHKEQKPKRRLRPALLLLLRTLCLLALFISLPFMRTFAQQKRDKKTDENATTSQAALLARTTSRRETKRLGYGSRVTLLGAPEGSVTIEGWNRNEIEIVADIELRAASEEDLARLAAVNSFLIDEDANHIRIISTGTHDKKYMKRVAKDFPKKLLGLPWKIDYRIRVPAVTDLEIDMGRGAFSLKSVEGAISFRVLEGDANLILTGGQISATIGRGSVNVEIAARSWRGAGAEVRLASGTLTVELPAGFNAEIDADILRTGQIENSYASLEARERTTMTPRSIKARAGAGGVTLTFTVGDGTLRIKQKTESAQ